VTAIARRHVTTPLAIAVVKPGVAIASIVAGARIRTLAVTKSDSIAAENTLPRTCDCNFV
jgi:hypothetical protein